MTQAGLNTIAQDMRARYPNYSWIEAFIFAKDVVGCLKHAYQSLLKNTGISANTNLSELDDTQIVVRDNLAEMLTLLTSEDQVSRWRSDALSMNINLNTE